MYIEKIVNIKKLTDRDIYIYIYIYIYKIRFTEKLYNIYSWTEWR